MEQAQQQILFGQAIIDDAKRTIRMLEGARKQHVVVIYVGDKHERKYTYVDDSGELEIGDLIKAGYKEGIAQVIGTKPYRQDGTILRKLPPNCKVELPLNQ